MRILIAATGLLSIATLTACDTVDSRCADAAKPAECRQVAEAGGDVSDYLMYGLAGYMIGSTMAGGQRQPVILTDPSYRGYRRQVPSYDASRSFVRNRAATAWKPSTSTTRTTSTVRYSSPSAYRTTYRPTTFRSSSMGRR